MASSNVPKLLLTALLFLSIILEYPAQPTSQYCPYPCYPPPTGPGNNPLPTPTPPAFLSPPTPQATIYPYNPPAPYSFGAVPPPPDAVVPWFPYYYKKPLHQDQSSSSPPPNDIGVLSLVFTFVLVCLFN